MKSFDEYLRLAGDGGHARSGIILGIRMAMLGLREIALDSSDDHHDLIVFVETDRCLPDAVELVTGCRLGNRRLKFQDMGKMAATFVNMAANRSIRVAARETANQRALEMFPDLDKEEALSKAYCAISDDELFNWKPVRVELRMEDLPGYQGPRVPCAKCGESIAFARQITVGQQALCRACAGQSYYLP
ncbi:MAG: hypothetical protein A3F68_11185 [Acidobacteria bacterium RIFCSPLOWO2_12_FULL_54_10]|nr:MAG: hypothetical protein A3F68_11185 [Acidobacteria bacterium RIFCSPLOWO2_12_FULL_54_10]